MADPAAAPLPHPGSTRPGQLPPPVSRRLVLGAATLAGAAALLGPTAPASAAGTVDLVARGRARAQFVVADNAPAAIRDAAAEAVTYLRRMTGVTLTVAASEPPTDLAAIYVGAPGARSARAAGAAGGRAAATPARDGYLIITGPRSVTVTGGGTYGVVNGIHALLRMLGVEWLLPGALGEVVPERDSATLPVGTTASDPVLAQRMFSPFHGVPGEGAQAAGNTWAAHQGLQGWHNAPVLFHHNLHTLFPVAEYGTTHPEYYANGKVPKPGVAIGWQPAFSNPATVDVAAQRIIAHFDANPTASSFSLGVNDEAGYEVGVDPVAAYYGWVNAVVAKVVAVHPGKQFGLLAYHQVEPVPSFSLHPAVVPFFTEDRYAWADPTQRQHSQALLTAWRARASSLGLYDYVYGWPYSLPRMYQGVMADALRFGVTAGASGLYAELYPNWGEGPKPWVLARLAWDPAADVDALTRQWCALAVGESGADQLKAYFDVWEEIWTERIITGSWFVPGSTYQNFTLPTYLAEVTEADLARAQTHLDAASAAAVTPQQQARAGLLQRVAEFYRTSVISYPREIAVPGTTADALTILEDQVAHAEIRTTAAQRRTALLAEFRTDPVLKPGIDPANYSTNSWSGANASALWALVVHLKRNEPTGGPVTARAQHLAATADTAAGRAFAASIARAAATPQVLANPSFEEVDPVDAGQSAAWVVLPRHTGTRAVQRDTTVAESGGASCRVTGTGWGGPMQTVAAVVGAARLSLRYRCQASSGAGSVQLAIDLSDATGARIGTIRSAVTSLTRDGQWHELSVTGEVPAAVTGKPVASLSVVPLYDTVGEILLWTDSVELFVVPPA